MSLGSKVIPSPSPRNRSRERLSGHQLGEKRGAAEPSHSDQEESPLL